MADGDAGLALAVRPPIEAVPEEGEDRPWKDFALQGLYDVCTMVSFAELLRLRQVCLDWESVVLNHPRLAEKAQILLGENWGRDAGFIDFERSIPWRAVHFRHFSFKSTVHFGKTWVRRSTLVTKLHLERIAVNCNELVDFLQVCPHLTNLKIERMYFRVQKVGNYQFNLPHGRRVIDTLTVHCVHNGWTPTEGQPLIAPRISTLTLHVCNYFPLCVLDYLATRCQGVLRNLTLSHARAGHKRYRHWPSSEDLDARYARIVTQSATVMESFNFVQMFRGDTILRRIIEADVTRPAGGGGPIVNGALNFRPTTVNIEQCYCWSAANDANVTHAYLDFLNQFGGPHMHTMELRIVHHLQFGGLVQALQRMPNLTKLSLRINWARDVLQLGPILATMPHLVDLHVKDRRRIANAVIPSGYMTNIPATIKRLEFSHRHMTPEVLMTVCSSPIGVNMTKLMIGFGRKVNDAMFQQIIVHFPNLMELEVSDSRQLTDAGVTGLPLKTCKTLIASKSYYVMLNHTAQITEHSVSELRFLKRLSFDGCRKISDVSLLLAIRFPNLRYLNLCQCLNVTDVGVSNLSRYNPGLETIFLRKNLKITHFGLNALITNCPGIQRIHTSRACRDRKLGDIVYNEHPRFKKVVTYGRWDEKITYRNL